MMNWARSICRMPSAAIALNWENRLFYRLPPEKQRLFLGTEHFQRTLFRPDLLIKLKQSNSQTLMSF